MSKLLSMLMSGGGGGITKVLNLEPVNGATYDSNYIMEGTTDSTNCPYFITKEKIDLRNTNNKIELRMKFMPTSSQSGFFCAEGTQTGWQDFCSCYVSSDRQLWLTVGGQHWGNPVLTLNTWYWVKLTKSANSNYYTGYYSTDGINYNYLFGYSFTDLDAMYMTFGLGASTGTQYGMRGKLDFRETDILINDQSVLWVEESNVEFKYL